MGDNRWMMRRRIQQPYTLVFTALLFSLVSSLQFPLKSDNVSFESDKPCLVSPCQSDSCLVCHTVHIRTCDLAPVTQTLYSRAPRQASSASSKTPIWSEKHPSLHQKVHQLDLRQNQPLHLVSGDEADQVSSGCLNEPSCGEGGRRTICKIRSLYYLSSFSLRPDLVTRNLAITYESGWISLDTRWVFQDQCNECNI